MPDPLAGLPPRYLRTPEAARFLGLSGRTLEKHRTYGTGPKYQKLGGRVVYVVDDLQDWVGTGTRQFTSEPGIGRVFPAKRVAQAFPAQGVFRRRACSGAAGAEAWPARCQNQHVEKPLLPFRPVGHSPRHILKIKVFLLLFVHKMKGFLPLSLNLFDRIALQPGSGLSIATKRRAFARRCCTR